ncbi:MAG: PP2C family protein-serine/threonine phosphatase [Chloroflexota bacterium]
MNANYTPQQPAGDRLALLYNLAQTFNSSLDLDEVLNRVIDEVIVAVRAERGFVMLHDEGGALAFRVARGMDQNSINEPVFQVSMSVVEWVAQQGEPTLTVDAQTDPRFSMQQSVRLLGLRSILCAPLKLKERVLGVVYVDNRVQSGIFTEDDLELLNSIASSAAVAIENARLYQVAVEKGRLERELQMARQVQASLLAEETPALPGWDFVARWFPAREVAGDYYDFIPDTADRLGVVVADVSDKGMPAALFMALTRSIVRASLDGAKSSAEGIARANRLICADATSGMFVTLFYALVDPSEGRVTYVNAGHNPPLFFQRRQSGAGQMTRLGRTGMALGVEAESDYQQFTLALKPGDFLLLYTDGVTDALNAQGEEFGLERLEQVVSANSSRTAPEIGAALQKAIEDFLGTTALFDDITLMVVQRK